MINLIKYTKYYQLAKKKMLNVNKKILLQAIQLRTCEKLKKDKQKVLS